MCKCLNLSSFSKNCCLSLATCHILDNRLFLFFCQLSVPDLFLFNDLEQCQQFKLMHTPVRIMVQPLAFVNERKSANRKRSENLHHRAEHTRCLWDQIGSLKRMQQHYLLTYTHWLLEMKALECTHYTPSTHTTHVHTTHARTGATWCTE